MAAPEALNCKSCGGKLPEATFGQRYILCIHCGTNYDTGAPPAVPVSPFGGAGAFTPGTNPFQPAHAQAPSPYRMLWYVVPIGLSLFASLVSAMVQSCRSSPTSPSSTVKASPASPTPTPTRGQPTPPGEDLSWGIGEQYPRVARINGDGVEDFVGGYTAGDEAWVAGFDGATFKSLWRAGPFGRNTTETRVNTHIAVANGKVIVTDGRGEVHILSLVTGAEQGRLHLSDVAKSVCVAPADKPQAWIEVADKRNTLVELGGALSSKPAPRPPWCPERRSSAETTHCDWYAPNSTCTPGGSGIPSAPGIDTRRVLLDGDLRVGIAVKSPGTEVAFAVGGRAGAKSPAWKTSIVEGDPAGAKPGIDHLTELSHGRFFALFETTNGAQHLTAFDARTGSRLWNVHLPFTSTGTGSSLIATEERLYFPSGKLFVLDARTGNLIGSVGR